MLNKILAKPWHVYLFFLVISIIGVLCASQLKVSLFPNSQQPEIMVSAGYVGRGPDEFKSLYGERLEAALRTLNRPDLEALSIETNYGRDRFTSRLVFNWGANPDDALREIRLATGAVTSSMSQEAIREFSVQPAGNDVFLGVAFYSDARSMNDLDDLLRPIVLPELQTIAEVQNIDILNPDARVLQIELKQDRLALLGSTPSLIADQISNKLFSVSGGTATAREITWPINIPSRIKDIQSLKSLPIHLPSGVSIPLESLAAIKLAPNNQAIQLAKVNGISSLFLIAQPKPGANIRDMSGEVLSRLAQIMKSLPKDVHYRVVMDPSSYVMRATRSLAIEVAMGSMVAALFLYLFIGNIRNVLTTAIEIPISILMAFILMQIFDINITLFSLSGLALAAGMNVDASVVVMENIFRRLEHYKGPRSLEMLLPEIVAATREVIRPITFSTLASLVVFAPFLMLKGFSYALLGELAMVVIFSHGFSAIVALVLVPTVRLHIMRNRENLESPPPLHALLTKMELAYEATLTFLLGDAKRGLAFFATIALLIGSTLLLVAPNIRKEVVQKPETDWIAIVVGMEGNASPQQIESKVALFEKKLKKIAGDRIDYTFTWIYDVNGANVLGHLKDKKYTAILMKELKAEIKSLPDASVNIGDWNMTEFSIASPADLRLTISGGSKENRIAAARDLKGLLDKDLTWESIESKPTLDVENEIVVLPKLERWSLLKSKGFEQSPETLMNDIRILQSSIWLGDLTIKNKQIPIFIKGFLGGGFSINTLKALPVRFGEKILPLSGLADIRVEGSPAQLFKSSGREQVRLDAKLDSKSAGARKGLEDRVEKILDRYRNEREKNGLPALLLRQEDSNADFHGSVHQLYLAFFSSVALIFLVLLLQFASFKEASIVMIAIPLGAVGATVSLWIFSSTISLNSLLGMTLLNGIAVNNSILLVDAMRRRFSESTQTPAIVAAACGRLRPIVITSLTTIAGMLPIALGLGEGGRVLQPLGISVAGGLSVSMALTLLIVPVLVGYVEIHWKKSPVP